MRVVFAVILFSWLSLSLAHEQEGPKLHNTLEEWQKEIQAKEEFQKSIAGLEFVWSQKYPVVDWKRVKLPELRRSEPSGMNFFRSQQHHFFTGYEVWHDMRGTDLQSIYRSVRVEGPTAACVDNPFADSALPSGLLLIAEHERNLAGRMCLNVINTTGKNALVPAMDGSLMICMEAKNRKGEWRPIETVKTSFCGGSYMSYPILPAGKAWEIPTHRYRGDFVTTMRFRMRSPKLISNEFAGSVNLKQFERGELEDDEFQFPLSRKMEELMK